MTDLQGLTALVTGSSRGIGAAIVRRLAAAGADVIVHGRDDEAVAAVRAQITDAGCTAISVVADLADYDQVEAMRTTIERQLGPIDVLVANAGGNPIPPGPVEDISVEGWHASIDANLTSTFLTLKSFLPGMKHRRHGTIITVSSAAARRPTAASPIAYAAAKAGIEVLTKQLAIEAGPLGIRVNCVAPETILTERNRERIPAAVQDQLCQAHPLQRLGTPDDVAELALFLASGRAAWISGVTVDVAGGAVLV